MTLAEVRKEVQSVTDFLVKLDCNPQHPVKVLCIFGNTGDGKSHTLNETFFGGLEVFRTSPTQDSCTVGVWAAYDPSLSLIVLDTEGLLGATDKQNQRLRLLLKVLAVSDLVVYRTRAERLHNDMFQFLGQASSAYLRFFTPELKALSSRCGLEVTLSSLGPALLIFHETSRTDLLGQGGKVPGKAENELHKRFHELGNPPEAFSSIRYVGVKTVTPPTDFSGLLEAVRKQVMDTSTRSSRPPGHVFSALQSLSERFSGDIPEDQISVTSFFPDEYFTCSMRCLSCRARCKNGMNHLKDGIPHEAEGLCQYAHQYCNKVYICKRCYEGGREVIVVPQTVASKDNRLVGLAKYAWAGYVLECRVCGIIFRSRQYWYGNRDPDGSVVRQEVRHVWSEQESSSTDQHNAAQRVLDEVNAVIQTVNDYSAGPTRAVASWLTDQVAPPYWRPNAQIMECHGCRKPFVAAERKHHCRACGEGFCHSCCSRTMPVPERGWGPSPVRVCEKCHSNGKKKGAVADDVGRSLLPRMVTEVAQSSVDKVSSILEYPLGFVKDAARPSYWVSDSEITNCHSCKKLFTPNMSRHHCRACGQGFCEPCSNCRRPVPSRGWHHPVRVCASCGKKNGDL
ncbi:zinc finger FYVE domain-containing protein 1 isoform X2 [Bombina bombina]|uniref:zinc finger FYVE domain-containing protein 1 isoform X2 n=1 Tax=Bombina bombina TaxID=8345 RepID=UPI00235B1C48|nr:zinc finger FYVE domain-containing protein 1 isoform X2 [Bombina bombina]XP_053577780.1 zinc finger FYVE domain-containing protein 1 isoform X2 [Bombina bombina]